MYLAESFFTKATDPIKKAFGEMYQSLVETLPNLIAAVVILIIGYLIASLLSKSLGKTLAKIKFDSILDKIGISAILTKIGLKLSPSSVIAKVLFYIVMLFIVKSAAQQLQIEDIANIIDNVVAFLPKAVISGIILLFGFMVAEMVQNLTRSALEAMNLEYARPLSNILFGFVFVIVLTVVLDQLNIQTELLNASVKILLGGIVLALAIALGIGLRGLAKAIVSGVYARDVYKVGTEIEIDGELCRVSGVGPVTTKLQKKDGGFVMMPNAELIENRVKGQSAE